LTGDEPSASAQTQSAETQSQSSVAPLALNTGSFAPSGVTPGEATGTAVGQRVQQMRDDLRRVQAQLGGENDSLQGARNESRRSAASYHTLKGTINARLQVGTTPGNPELVNQWNEAQRELASVDRLINEMNAIANNTASTASLASYLVESTRATYSISGAVDEDHRQLAILEDEVNQTMVLIDRLLYELTQDISRQSAYLASERANLNTMSVAIKNGEYVGVSLANLAYGAPTPIPTGGGAGFVGRQQPLIAIRFDVRNVAYEQQLYSAVSRALDRRPNAGFDVVAVAPGQGSQAQMAMARGQVQRDAERVLRSLADMGLPADRVSLSAASSPAVAQGEVHVYVR
jgi:hypothetical protein